MNLLSSLGAVCKIHQVSKSARASAFAGAALFSSLRCGLPACRFPAWLFPSSRCKGLARIVAKPALSLSLSRHILIYSCLCTRCMMMACNCMICRHHCGLSNPPVPPTARAPGDLVQSRVVRGLLNKANRGAPRSQKRGFSMNMDRYMQDFANRRQIFTTPFISTPCLFSPETLVRPSVTPRGGRPLKTAGPRVISELKVSGSYPIIMAHHLNHLKTSVSISKLQSLDYLLRFETLKGRLWEGTVNGIAKPQDDLCDGGVSKHPVTKALGRASSRKHQNRVGTVFATLSS